MERIRILIILLIAIIRPIMCSVFVAIIISAKTGSKDQKNERVVTLPFTQSTPPYPHIFL